MTATGYTSGDPNKVDVSNETSPVGFGLPASASYKISVGVGSDISSVYSLNQTSGGNLTAPHFRADSSAVNSLLVTSRVTGDSAARFAITVGGEVSWGSGSGSRDVNLKRETTDILRTDDKFVIGGAISSVDTYANLPKGFTGRSENGTLIVGSSYAGGDDNGSGTDSTGRINLYAYQRADVGSFGETIRNFLMRSDAKAMTVWYGPENGSKKSNYDATTRDPKAGSTWRPWTWTGSHFEANSHSSVHGHWEVEVPDATGALQGRLEIPFIDQSKLGGLGGTLDNTTIGVDWTNIRTNLADFSLRAQNITTGDFTGQNTALRIGGNNTVNKDVLLSISSDMQNAGRRWIIRGNIDTETGSGNNGTNFEIIRCSDAGAVLDSPLFINRGNGQIGLGGTTVTGGQVRANWSTSGRHGFYAVPSASPGTAAAFATLMTATTDRVLDVRVGADTNARIIIDASGKIEMGDGSVRDTNLYRSAANVLKTDDKLITAIGLGVGNSAAATTAVGTLARKMEVFDAAGASLGFIPIYATIS